MTVCTNTGDEMQSQQTNQHERRTAKQTLRAIITDVTVLGLPNKKQAEHFLQSVYKSRKHGVQWVILHWTRCGLIVIILCAEQKIYAVHSPCPQWPSNFTGQL